MRYKIARFAGIGHWHGGWLNARGTLALTVAASVTALTARAGDANYRIGYCYIRSHACVIGKLSAPTRVDCEAIAQQLNRGLDIPGIPPQTYQMNGGWYRCLGRVKGWGPPPFEVVPWR